VLPLILPITDYLQNSFNDILGSKFLRKLQ